MNLVCGESNKIRIPESMENLWAGSLKIGVLIKSIPDDFILKCHYYFFITDIFLLDFAKHMCFVYDILLKGLACSFTHIIRLCPSIEPSRIQAVLYTLDALHLEIL